MPKTIAPAANKEPQANAKRGRGRPAGVKGKKIAKIHQAENFKIFLFRIMKKCAPDEVGISKEGMSVMNSILMQVYRKITSTVAEFHKHSIKGPDIQTAVKLLIPGELGKHAVTEGSSAVMKFN